jgi:hypothetical protein
MLSKLSPIFWLLFLAILLMKTLRVKTTVTNVPTAFQTALERALRNSKYKKHLVNWVAISKMETNKWTSSIYTLWHNPWGMRPSDPSPVLGPNNRADSQDGFVETKNGKFAKYKNLDRAAQDIVLYMDARKFPTEEMDLLSFVQYMKSKGYFVEPVDYYYKAVKAQLER